MIKKAIENVEEIKYNEINITDLRYVDDAVLVADKRKKVQKMIDRLNKTCKAYQMEVNVKKDKSDDYEWNGKTEGDAAVITLDKVPLEQVTHFKYLGSWT